MCRARLLTLCTLMLTSVATQGARLQTPVPALAMQAFALHTATGNASVPLDSSIVLGVNHPEITRAAIVLHGKGRNVQGYFRALQNATAQAGSIGSHTLLLAPQFLREEDIQAHRLPNQFLRWHEGSWSAGELAVGPLPYSSFDVIDALLGTLGDRTKFPNLTTVVLIGHSGGGQLLNRYAIAGKQPAALQSIGISVRFVIANPSSYFYFTDDRPQPDGSFAPFKGANCAHFNQWRYGPANAPAYIADTSTAAWQKRESDYAKANVIYLMGADDTDPEQQDLDTSCAGEAEGPDRLDRGKAYFRYLTARHSDFGHRFWLVPGVAHVGSRMVESACAVAAVFDSGNCTTQVR